MENENQEQMTRLYRAFVSIRTEAEAQAFLEDLCSTQERVDMGQRLETARRLAKGENYQSIEKELGISSTTISRVSRCVNDQDPGNGYRMVLKRLGDL